MGIMGSPPFGWRIERWPKVADDSFVEDDREQGILNEIVKLRSQQWAYNSIANHLNAAGKKPRKAPMWLPNTVRNVFKKWEERGKTTSEE